MAKKNAVANFRAWQAKLNKGEGEPENIQKHLDRWKCTIEDLESAMVKE